MSVLRIKPNILSERFDESRAFYKDVIGLDGGDGLEWVLFFGTDKPEVQLSVMKLDIKADIHPDVSIEVDDVDAVHDRARAAGAEIVYPLTDEEWGLRRFFLRDPNGAVLNNGTPLAQPQRWCTFKDDGDRGRSPALASTITCDRGMNLRLTLVGC
jgi:catechol 2,3-dioxygenase-like lactoylglutathione lyase family enzyme